MIMDNADNSDNADYADNEKNTNNADNADNVYKTDNLDTNFAIWTFSTIKPSLTTWAVSQFLRCLRQIHQPVRIGGSR